MQLYGLHIEKQAQLDCLCIIGCSSCDYNVYMLLYAGCLQETSPLVDGDHRLHGVMLSATCRLSYKNLIAEIASVLYISCYNYTITLTKLKDMVAKANYLFASFPGVGPSIMTHLFRSYCLSLHGSSLWSLSSPALHFIEVTFNKTLRNIWRLHYHSHSAIVHLVAKLDSLFNVVYCRSNSTASKCPSMLVRAVFRYSATVCEFSTEYLILSPVISWYLSS